MMTSPHGKLPLLNSSFTNDSTIGNEIKYGTLSLSSLSSEKDNSPYKSPTILSFDAYGNLTSSDEPEANDVPSVVKFDQILNCHEKDVTNDKFSEGERSLPNKRNGAYKKNKSKKMKCTISESISLSDNDLKQAFKKDFDTTSLGITSRYGRTRKQKKSDEGFLFGTLNFNELRKITSVSPPKGKHFLFDEKSNSEFLVENDSKKVSINDFDLITSKLNYSSEDEFVNGNNKKISIKSSRKKSNFSQKTKRKKNSFEKMTTHKRAKHDKINIISKASKNKALEIKSEPEKEQDEEDSLLVEKANSNNLVCETETAEPLKNKVAPSKMAKQSQTLPDNNLTELKSIDDDVNIIKSSLIDDSSKNTSSSSKNTSEKLVINEVDNVEFKVKSKTIPNKRNKKVKIFGKSDLKNTERKIFKIETLNDEIEVEAEASKSKYKRKIKKAVPLNNSAENKNELSEAPLTSVIQEEELLEASSKNDQEVEKECPCLFFAGDLVWVNVKGSPLWPAMITYSKNDANFTKLKYVLNNKFKGRHYHVQFFYDNHQTMWASSTSIIAFSGLQNLSLHIEKLKENIKELNLVGKNWIKTFTKMSSVLTLKASSSRKSLQWHQAVEEANQAMNMERSERIQHFKAPLKEKKKNRKRSLPTEDAIEVKSEPDSFVKVKSEPGSETTTLENIKFETQSNISSKSSDDFSGFEEDSSFESRKAKRSKLEGKIKRGDFEVYLQKHLDSVMESANLPKDKAKKLLKKKWSQLSLSQKLRYKSKHNYEQPSSGDTDDSSSDISIAASFKARKRALEEDEIQEPSKGTFKVPRHEKVCAICETTGSKSGGDIVKCKGVCGSHFHLACVGLNTIPLIDFKCVECLSGSHKCFICKSDEGQRHKCSVVFCGKFYHDKCLKVWPQVSRITNSKQIEKVVCPRHVCHMCAANADNINDPAARTPPFTRCIRCPTTYHTGETCVAAGVEELSQNYHICTKHIEISKARSHHFNVNWCFCCSKGGSLLLCDQCPAAFHAECLNITAPEGGYICEDCENGKFPVYGDIVWVKLGVYRWWPGEVLHPRYIPDNIENLNHVQGMFCVHFFGSDDYYWLTRGRTFHYQEGDQGSKSTASKMFEQKFQKALDEAIVAYRKQKEKREKQERSRSLKGNMRPPPYVKIDTNKPVGNVRLGKLDTSTITKCDCDPYSENPCGSDDKCINRMLMVECIKEICAGKERCNNQRFQRRQYPNVFPFKTSGRGWGLKTKDEIKKGSFVIEYVGELIDETEFRRRIDEMHENKEQNYYFLTVEQDRMIDAGPKGNLSRFMNHSCHPNCETQKWTVGADTRVGLFALDDIPEDSELTFNYNLECVGTEKKICNCGADNCSGFIGVKVQKFDVSAGSKKIENGIKKKKRGRKKKSEKDTDNECFRCGYEGDLILCDVTTCPKGYHLDCLGLKELPKGKWICPWHHCDDCGLRAFTKCVLCPNSFCKVHTNDKFNPSATSENICLDHCSEEIEAFRGRMKVEMKCPPAEAIVQKCQPETDSQNALVETSIKGKQISKFGTREGIFRNQQEKKLEITKPVTDRSRLRCNSAASCERVLRSVSNNNNDKVANKNVSLLKRTKVSKSRLNKGEKGSDAIPRKTRSTGSASKAATDDASFKENSR